MALTQEQVDQQRKQAEELLFSGPQSLGFAKGLYFGHFQSDLLIQRLDVFLIRLLFYGNAGEFRLPRTVAKPSSKAARSG